MTAAEFDAWLEPTIREYAEEKVETGEIEAFVYDIAIHEDRRGQGYGRAAMLACAERARELGAHSVGLHVFGRNTVARGLYTSLGFQEPDVTMSLPLGTEGDRAAGS